MATTYATIHIVWYIFIGLMCLIAVDVFRRMPVIKILSTSYIYMVVFVFGLSLFLVLHRSMSSLWVHVFRINGIYFSKHWIKGHVKIHCQFSRIEMISKKINYEWFTIPTMRTCVEETNKNSNKNNIKQKVW